MLAIVCSAALLGIDAVPVQVEVNTGESGIPNLILVGLPDAAVKESEDRVFSALSNSGLRMPRTRTTINLAPGDLRKEGAIYDLPIAIGILVATGQLVCENLGDYLIDSELSLSGARDPPQSRAAAANRCPRGCTGRRHPGLRNHVARSGKSLPFRRDQAQ